MSVAWKNLKAAAPHFTPELVPSPHRRSSMGAVPVVGVVNTVVTTGRDHLLVPVDAWR